MTYVVYGSPPPPPYIPVPIWEGLRHTWTGWDGTSFDLTEGTAGVWLGLDGVTGLHLPEFDQYMDEHASVDGARYRGTRTRVRQPSWVVGIFGDNSKQWRDRDVAFWRSLDPERPGMWTVTDPDGLSRSLMCRLRSSTEHSFGDDPLYAGWSVYSVDLLAEQPYWLGAPVLSPVWGADSGTPFTGVSDAAPSYWVSAATTLGSAELANPGDVDGWLTYTATGPFTSLSITAGGGDLGFGEVLSGQTLKISTDPTMPVATLNGVDVTGQMTAWDPRPIPAGESTPLEITVVGSGTVQASFVPRFRRAL